ncbi:MAG: N-acetylneuraminic acid mutarotase [Salibacteraceae bacterium]|mgnify:FL=1|jgi:N-acetylneuraminic acid mutarotase
MKNLHISFIFLLSCLLAIGQSNWKTKAPFPGVARHHPIAFSLIGNGYVLAGTAGAQAGGADTYVKDFYRYDPISNTWTKMADFPGVARSFSYAVTNDGKAYVGFGISSTNQYLNDLWEYDPIANTWKQLASCSCVGRFHPAFVSTANGKLFVGAGGSATGNRKDWYEYNISSNSWLKHPDLPGDTRHHPYFFGIGTDAYVGMGHGTTFVPGFRLTSTNIYNDFYKFNTVNNSWTKLSDFPGEGRVAGSQFNNGKYGYIISGENEQHQNFDSGYFYQYTPDLDSWIKQESHPGNGSRWATGTFVVDNMVYLVGGEDASGLRLNEMLSFDLSTIEEEETDPNLNVGVESLFGESNFQMFPNPASDVLNFQIDSDSETSVCLFDLNGKLITKQTISKSESTISLVELDPGIYIVQIDNEGVIVRERLIKN